MFLDQFLVVVPTLFEWPFDGVAKDLRLRIV